MSSKESRCGAAVYFAVPDIVLGGLNIENCCVLDAVVEDVGREELGGTAGLEADD